MAIPKNPSGLPNCPRCGAWSDDDGKAGCWSLAKWGRHTNETLPPLTSISRSKAPSPSSAKVPSIPCFKCAERRVPGVFAVMSRALGDGRAEFVCPQGHATIDFLAKPKNMSVREFRSKVAR